MQNLTSAKLAGKILLIGLLLLAVFHVLVLLKLAPSDIVWSGQVGDSASSMILMEMLSLVVTLLFILVVALRLDYICKGRLKTSARIGMWVIFVFFVLNMIGNLASKVSVENLIFAPITLILAALALRLAIEK